MTDQRTVRVSVFNAEEYDGDWPTQGYPANLVEAIAWFQNKLEEIPEEFRSVAKCEIGSASGYEGSHYGEISIWYLRDETKKETARRIADGRAKADLLRDQELATLKALQSKYRDHL